VRRQQLVWRGLTFYWRTNLAVVLGVATAVAVLTGALLVGASVRASLRSLVLDRIGRTDDVIASAHFFTETLAASIEGDSAFARSFQGVAPLIVARGIVTRQDGTVGTAEADGHARVGAVTIYGVDDRFWRFHGIALNGPGARDAYVSQALADALHLSSGVTLVLRLQRVSDVPIESLHGRKESVGRSVRVTLAAVLPRERLGEFSLTPAQGDVRAVFVPLALLQKELDAEGRINTILVARRPDVAATAASRRRPEDSASEDSALTAIVRRQATLADAGIEVAPVDVTHTLVVSTTAGVIDDRDAAQLRQGISRAGLQAQPVFTYLANGMRIGARDLPYSLVSALDLPSLLPGKTFSDDSIVLNEWAASDLQARVGDPLTMEYYAWEEPGRLVIRTARFTVAGVVPIAAGGRDLSPTFPGITDSPTLDDWDPPFPLDLKRVRHVDEEYWNTYRTTPKAFIPIAAGQRMWATRYGALTSLRVKARPDEPIADAATSLTRQLRQSLDPLAVGMAVRDIRSSGLDASAGATDFGEYFVYFSVFLVVSALLLTTLFFRLAIEQRLREVGLLRAVGFGPGDVRRQFLLEGLLLALAGSVLGIVAAIGYAGALMLGLRTWWVDAVGTTALRLHVDGMTLGAGALSGLVATLVCIVWTLRSLSRVTERSLLMGEPSRADRGRAGHQRVWLIGSAAMAAAGALLVIAGTMRVLDATSAFFGAGVAIMAAALGFLFARLRRPPHTATPDVGWRTLSRLGVRYAAYRPGRTVLSAAVIASATFILIAVGAFRQDVSAVDGGRRSGTGGYALIVDTLLPIVHDPNSGEGRDALNLTTLGSDVRIEPMRVLAGDDASCLNLYQPKSPRIVAPQDSFLRDGRFTFDNALTTTEEERANPWLVLLQAQSDGAVPVVADANSMTYVLHRALGDVIDVPHGEGRLRLRLVGALHDSVFQGELLMSRENFARLFPEVAGYQRLLVDASGGREQEVSAALEDALADNGASVETTGKRLAQFHKVENTYLSTFQTLGGLGLLLGTVGLGAVLLRNALERRRELALLGAVGFRRAHFLAIIVSENALLLGVGVLTGVVAALVAVIPAVLERGGRLPVNAGGVVLVFAVIVTGLLSSLVAIRAATRGSLLSSLRSE
jgi:putative ABC transport system permease protein